MREYRNLIMDIDGTICPIKSSDEEYSNLVPDPKVVRKIKEYKEEGFYIILNTSRNMRTYNGSLGLINKYTARELLQWLDKHDIPYDEIYYGKPWQGEGGFYVDDKTIRPAEFINLSYEEILKIIEPKSNE